MKIAVSACLMGKNCKYNGGNNLNKRVIDFIGDKELDVNKFEGNKIQYKDLIWRRKQNG